MSFDFVLIRTSTFMFLLFSNYKLICFNLSVCYLFFFITNIFGACHNCMYPSHVFIYSLLVSLKQNILCLLLFKC